MKDKVAVHIKLKNGRFYNGLILEIAEEEFLIILDRINGETPVFFTEMIAIETYTDNRRKDGEQEGMA
jgi:hypothetical protein